MKRGFKLKRIVSPVKLNPKWSGTRKMKKTVRTETGYVVSDAINTMTRVIQIDRFNTTYPRGTTTDDDHRQRQRVRHVFGKIETRPCTECVRKTSANVYGASRHAGEYLNVRAAVRVLYTRGFFVRPFCTDSLFRTEYIVYRVTRILTDEIFDRRVRLLYPARLFQYRMARFRVLSTRRR